MKYGSLFSGIGGFDLGCDGAGMECVWQCEKDAHCLKILERHWPGVRRYEDVNTLVELIEGNHGRPVRPDLICGGFPCQDVSLAGRRAGLAGERSGLWFVFERIIAALAPAWVLIENVPGLLSSHQGRDMGAILAGLGELGYGWAYRMFDSQYFGLAQRRQRLFIVGCLGDVRRAAEVLFEREGLPWDPAPRRQTGQGVAGDVAACLNSGGNDGEFRTDPGSHLVPLVARCLAKASNTGGHRLDGESDTFVVAHALTSGGHDAGEDGTRRGVPLVANPITAHEGKTYTHEGKNNFRTHNLVNQAEKGGGGVSVVRRLTPL